MKLSRKDTILVVDDEQVTRMHLAHVLSKRAMRQHEREFDQVIGRVSGDIPGHLRV